MSEKKLFAITSERGSYSDYTKDNLFLVKTQEEAESIAAVLNDAAERTNDFVANELETFGKEYLAAHPRPQPLAGHNLVRPEVPECLDGIPKKQKMEYPIYQEFLTELQVYEAKLEEWKAACAARDAEISKWYTVWESARQDFLVKNLHPQLKLPKNYRDKLLTYLDCTYSDVTFKWEQLDLLPS